jgi:hypothetical protein
MQPRLPCLGHVTTGAYHILVQFTPGSTRRPYDPLHALSRTEQRSQLASRGPQFMFGTYAQQKPTTEPLTL